MKTTFDVKVAPEKGVAIIQVVFTDEDDKSVTPNADTIKWTLTNRPADLATVATIINSREQVTGITSAATINIVLEGDDLQILTGEESERFVERALLLEWQYDSSVQSGLDAKAQHIFPLENHHYTT